VTYPFAGLLLALGLPAGLMIIHAAFYHPLTSTPATTWVLQELAARPLTYGYLLFSGILLLVLLGRMIGHREDQLEAMSVTDALTGLANRRRLLAALSEEIKRATRYGTPVALLLIDVDHLKEINDRAGHAAGDRALQQVAESIRRSCRATDIAARIGGDELAVLAASTTAAEALALAERVRANLRRREADLRPDETPEPPLSISVGVADVDRAPASTIEALYLAADESLYQAKSAGRDRVVVAPPRRRARPRVDHPAWAAEEGDEDAAGPEDHAHP
jgi:diguanylate cyclase (GGDEF)-like protein